MRGSEIIAKFSVGDDDAEKLLLRKYQQEHTYLDSND